MNTVVSDWYIVSVFEHESRRLMGRCLYGDVVEDPTNRFRIGSFVCTSVIKHIDPDTRTVYTDSGSVYELLDAKGKQFDAWLPEVELLRNGVSPQEVVAQRQISL